MTFLRVAMLLHVALQQGAAPTGVLNYHKAPETWRFPDDCKAPGWYTKTPTASDFMFFSAFAEGENFDDAEVLASTRISATLGRYVYEVTTSTSIVSSNGTPQKLLEDSRQTDVTNVLTRGLEQRERAICDRGSAKGMYVLKRISFELIISEFRRKYPNFDEQAFRQTLNAKAKADNRPSRQAMVLNSSISPGWASYRIDHQAIGRTARYGTILGVASGIAAYALAQSASKRAAEQFDPGRRDYYDNRASVSYKVSVVSFVVGGAGYTMGLFDALTGGLEQKAK